MSSHHIVREKQEPALLVLSLDGFSGELLGQLLEWSPTVITTLLTAEQVNSQGIKVDIMISDEAGPNLQSDVRLIPAGDNVIKAAFDFLLQADYGAVNIITDDVHLHELIPYADSINLVVFSGNQKIYPVQPGFSKWKPAGEGISLLSTACNLTVTGLTPAAGIHYITTIDGFFTLDFDAPFLFIAEDV